MLGTLVLGILVVGIVLLFTTIAFDLGVNDAPEEQPVQIAHVGKKEEPLSFVVKKDSYRNGCSIYLNDKLLYSGNTTSDTTLVAELVNEENAIIVVDRTTENIQIADVPAKKGTYLLVNDRSGLQLVKQ